MLTKITVIDTITRFPDKFSIDDLIDQLILIDKIEKGFNHSINGNVISYEELDKRTKEWFK
ncbi:MAG: hypothetical protein A2046_00645 [Bacteroidetes bacterium GWA2_30_7]|nr:MAG: hypothetical protein A2046_00645 [Bacteroidetes bacterium GWA2_30_7]